MRTNVIYIYIYKIFIFIIVFILLWNSIFNILWINKSPISLFYKEPKNSLDIVYIGSSNVYAYFNTTLAYNQYGFKTGIFATDMMPFLTYKYAIEESSKTQNPKLYVIDLATSIASLDVYSEGDFRRTIDSFKFSKTRRDLIKSMYEYKDYLSFEINDINDFYFSYLMYHNKWKEITESSFNNEKKLFKGYLFTYFQTRKEKHIKYDWNCTEKKLINYSKEILEDLLEYLNKNNINVLFTIPVKVYTLEQNQYLNNVTKIIEKNGYKVINFNKVDDLNIDFDNDLYNASHLNVYGATKYTLYFSKYLKSNYNLPDHRNNEKYSSWKSEYERFKTEFNNLTQRNFDELLDN